MTEVLAFEHLVRDFYDQPERRKWAGDWAARTPDNWKSLIGLVDIFRFFVDPRNANGQDSWRMDGFVARIKESISFHGLTVSDPVGAYAFFSITLETHLRDDDLWCVIAPLANAFAKVAIGLSQQERTRHINLEFLTLYFQNTQASPSKKPRKAIIALREKAEKLGAQYIVAAVDTQMLAQEDEEPFNDGEIDDTDDSPESIYEKLNKAFDALKNFRAKKQKKPKPKKSKSKKTPEVQAAPPAAPQAASQQELFPF
jgi:hypothetical protein